MALDEAGPDKFGLDKVGWTSFTWMICPRPVSAHANTWASIFVTERQRLSIATLMDYTCIPVAEMRWIPNQRVLTTSLPKVHSQAN